MPPSVLTLFSGSSPVYFVHMCRLRPVSVTAIDFAPT